MFAINHDISHQHDKNYTSVWRRLKRNQRIEISSTTSPHLNNNKKSEHEHGEAEENKYIYGEKKKEYGQESDEQKTNKKKER